VRGHRTMNLSVPVVGVGLWVLWEPLWGHVLNICRPYFPRDEWRFEFPPNRQTATDPPVCVVTEPWICRFRLSAPDCECRENCSEVTCSIYVVHISPEMNGGLNSRQTTTSFHPLRPLSLAFLFDFFWCHTKNHATYFHSNKLEFKT
jgi:hypothetical protein